MWVIDVAGAGSIVFIIDDSAFGINGRPPCTRDYIEFFNGTGSNSASQGKICGLTRFDTVTLTPITINSSRAGVVFTGSANQNRPASRVGVRVTYTAT